MNKMPYESYCRIQQWIYKNARPLELALWEHLYEDASPNPVLKYLRSYQNPDGGFGNALEADLWNPQSSPYTTYWAIHILKMINLEEKNHPLIQGILRYLNQCKDCSEKGWDFSIPGNSDFPHAPWWRYDKEGNTLQNLGLTAELSAFVLKHSEEDSPVYTKALGFTRMLVETLQTQDKYGEMGIKGYMTLLEYLLSQAHLSNDFDTESLSQILKTRMEDSIEYDSSKWTEYTVRPSQYLNSPQDIFYPGNEDIMSKELDFIIQNRNTQGVWNITWSWYDNTEKYPKEFAISENWWMAYIAINNVGLLKSFGRLEGSTK